MAFLLAIVLGVVNVVSKSINYQATLHLGKWGGSLMNYIVASIIALCLGFVLPGSLSLESMASVPPWLYLGGVFGVIAFFFNITSLNTMNLFMSTLIILSGQMLGASILDILFERGFSLIKVIGVLLILAGAVWDKKLIVNK